MLFAVISSHIAVQLPPPEHVEAIADPTATRKMSIMINFWKRLFGGNI